MIEASRLLPKILTALFIGFLLLGLIHLETREKNIKENTTSDDNSVILSINRIATFFSNDATKRERRERRSIEETKIKRLIKSIKNFKKISERDERFTDFNRTESLPTDKVFKSSPSSVNKCNQDFLQKNVLVLIAVCCFLLILTGCLICIVLPWNLWRYFKKRKEFSPNKWWMSGDDDIYDIGALLRQRKKYLQKQQLTFENNLLTPLLSVNTQYLPRK